LFLLDGELTISLRSGTPVYAAFYFCFYFTAAVLYLWLQRSDPGFLKTEEHHSLLEDGAERRRSKDRLRWLPLALRMCRHTVWHLAPAIELNIRISPEISTLVF
jgi:hypothetical protein